MTEKPPNDEDHDLTSTRRTALKIAAGAATVTTLGATPVTAQTADRQQWVFETDGWVQSSPTVVDNMVFVGSNDEALYAIDTDSGDQQWSFETGGYIESSPNVVDGTVYVGSNDNILYAIDADTGSSQWTFTTESSVASSPTVIDGTVFVGSSDTTLYAINTETGEQKWAYTTSGSVVSSPTVAAGTVFVGDNDGGTLYALDAETGKEEWSLTMSGFVSKSPTVVDGTVFIGDWDYLHAIDVDSGTIQWRYEAWTDSSPTVANGTVFVGCNGTDLVAIDAETGEEQWVSIIGDFVSSSPTVVDKTVYVGCVDNNLYAIDTETGSEEWRFEADNAVNSAPTVVDGTIYVGSADKRLYAIKADVEGSSEDSRVRLGTLGHHHIWSDKSFSEPSSANFTVSNLTPDGRTTTRGNMISVTADIENTGKKSASQTVIYRLDSDTDDELETGEDIASKSISLDGGDTATVTFEDIETGFLPEETVTYAHGVFTKDDRVTGSITVEPDSEPAASKISNLRPDGTTVSAGDLVTVRADIENIGDETLTQTITLRIDSDQNGILAEDETVSTQEVELEGRSSTDISFDIDTTTLSEELTYTYGIFTGDDDAAAEMTIVVDDGDEDDDESGSKRYTSDDGYVNSEGLLNAGADYRNGEIDAETLNEVASAFRSGEPLS